MKTYPPHFAFLSCTFPLLFAVPFSLYKSLNENNKKATAASVLMAAIADRHYRHQPATANPPDHPTRRSSGRRKAKGGDSSGQKKAKQPQRGMGVEKLERLRVQEGLLKMAENALPLPDPVQKIDGFDYPGRGAYLGFQYGQVDLLSPGAANVVRCYAGHCTSCHKKKKFNGGECGFVGLNNIGEYQKVQPTVGNIGKQGGVEVVAVHRKGGRGSAFGEGGVVMEYEFFPISDKSDIHDDGEQGLVVMNFRDDSGFDAVDLSLKL